jgi:glucose/arabinose dehydrogenase
MMLQINNRMLGLVVSIFVCIPAQRLHAQPKPRRSDIKVKQLATVGRNTVRIKRDPASGNLYILQNNGLVQRVDLDASGTATITTVYQTSDHGLGAPLGMTFGQDGTMYLVGNNSTTQFGSATIVKGVLSSPGSENRIWSVIAQTVSYPYGNIYNHRMNGIILNPTGDSLYVNSGAATDHGEMHDGYRETGLTSIILKLPTSGDNITLQDDREWLRTNGYLFAEGIRNTFDFAYAGNGDLFGVENSGDRDDPEELNWIREGLHYGFPWRIGGDITPQQFSPYDPHSDSILSPNAWGGGQGRLYITFSDDPTYPPPPAGVVFTDPVPSFGPDADRFRDTTKGDFGEVEDASDLGITLSTFTPHRSPDGIVFDRDSLLAGDLRGGAFVISFSNSRLITALGDTSQDLFHVALTNDANGYTAHVTKLVSGFNSPLGVELVGNILYVVETGLQSPANPAPKLWEITLPTVAITTVGDADQRPSEFELYQNHPNPFNPTTVITYQTPTASFVTLEVFDVLGREITMLVNEEASPGVHSVTWDASRFPSGVYFCRMRAMNTRAGQTNEFVETRKMILVR